MHIPGRYVRDFHRLLTGGIWAQLDMRFEYDEETKGKNPFWNAAAGGSLASTDSAATASTWLA